MYTQFLKKPKQVAKWLIDNSAFGGYTYKAGPSLVVVIKSWCVKPDSKVVYHVYRNSCVRIKFSPNSLQCRVNVLQNIFARTCSIGVVNCGNCDSCQIIKNTDFDELDQKIRDFMPCEDTEYFKTGFDFDFTVNLDRVLYTEEQLVKNNAPKYFDLYSIKTDEHNKSYSERIDKLFDYIAVKYNKPQWSDEEMLDYCFSHLIRDDEAMYVSDIHTMGLPPITRLTKMREILEDSFPEEIANIIMQF